MSVNLMPEAMIVAAAIVLAGFELADSLRDVTVKVLIEVPADIGAPPAKSGKET